MTDQPNEQEAPAVKAAAEPDGPGRLRATLARRDSRGRPIAVYGILGAGVLALTLLMVIVYFSSSDRSQPELPICTSIDAGRAQQSVREGQVERLIVAFDEGAAEPTDSTWGPVLAQLDYLDGQCAYLPQGLVNQEGIMAVIGAITFYNQTTDSAQVEMVYNQMTNLDPSLFQAATEAPRPTEAPTEAPASPTAAPTETPLPTEAPASPAATPEGTPPAGTPLATEATTTSLPATP
jgi:hypothetical protein